MPSKSISQQRFMGMVHSLQKGELDPSDVSQTVRDVAATMKKKDAKDFASTKHKGLPKKVKEYSFIGDKHSKTVDDEDFPHGKSYRTDEALKLKSNQPDTIKMLSAVLPNMKNLKNDDRKKVVKDLIKTLNDFYGRNQLDVKIS